MAETQPLNRDRAGGKSFNWRPVIGRALAVLAGAVFVYAGVLKVRDPLQFANDVSNYDILPWSVGVWLAFYLPWLEILCGLALIFHRVFAGALAITGALIFIFIGATIWAKIQGIDVACGCFGTASSNLTLTWHLVINSSILAVLIVLWFTRKSLDPAAQMHGS
jgi:putative oxidoreductase